MFTLFRKIPEITKSGTGEEVQFKGELKGMFTNFIILICMNVYWKQFFTFASRPGLIYLHFS